MVIITAGHGDHVYGYGKHYNYFLVKICGLFYNMAHANCITSYLCASFESYQFVWLYITYLPHWVIATCCQKHGSVTSQCMTYFFQNTDIGIAIPEKAAFLWKWVYNLYISMTNRKQF